MARVSVVIPTHDSRAWLDACLSSVVEQQGVDLAVAVVDNASSDGTAEYLRQRWSAVKVVPLRENVGYGAAVNRGVDALPDGHVLALNVDATLGPGCIAQMIRALESDPRIGAVAPRLRNPGGQLQPSAYRFPRLSRLLGSALFLDRLSPLEPVFGALDRRYSYDHRHIVDWAAGAVLLVRDVAWRAVSGFDPSYFFFVEEIDLQHRLRNLGFSIVIEPDAEATHHGGRRPLSAELFLHSHAGYERYFGLTGGRRAAFLARLILCLTALTRAVGWFVIGLVRPRRRREAAQWVTMFVGALFGAAREIPAITRKSYTPYPTDISVPSDSEQN